MLAQRVELTYSGEHVNEFVDTSAEEIEFAEYLVLAEVKLLSFWHREELLLCRVILSLVGLVELDASSSACTVARRNLSN